MAKVNNSANQGESDSGWASAEKTITVIGFGQRLAATLIDSIMVGFFGFMLAFCIGFAWLFVDIFRPNASGKLELVTILCLLLFSVVYYVGFWTTEGQTLGKTLLGIKVVRTDGSPVSWGRALLRYLGYIVNLIPMSLGFLWSAFDRRRQGWHDKIAGTYVVYVDDHFSDADAVEFVPSDHGKGWIWLALWAISAIAMPVGAVSGLLVLGPYITKSLFELIQSLL